MSEATATSEFTNSTAAEREALKQKAAAAKAAVVDLATEAGRFAKHRAEDVKGHAVEWGHTCKEKAEDVNAQVINYVRTNPYKSLAIAAGVGLLAGVLLKRR